MEQKIFTILVALILNASFGFSQSFTTNNLELKTAKGHPIQYYVSLPTGWAPTKKWPVVLVLEGAAKEYKLNAERFASARGMMPFIILAPIHTNNGRQGRRDPTVFPYSKETWDYIDKVGDCQFNEEGIRQILSEVGQDYHAEEKIFITAFESGAHQLWSIVFNHPEYLKAAAPVAGNYSGRCVNAQTISKDPSKLNLPIMAFAGLKDNLYEQSPLSGQWKEVKKLAETNGFNNVNETLLANKGHVPIPEEVFNYFFKFLGH
jgi:poly(3-hydroxybutyrate) depolymerase